MKSNHRSAGYVESEPRSENRPSVPILASQIGTRIAQTADRLGVRRNAYEIAGVSSATLQRYVAEDTAPTFDAMARLCLATGVRMEWLATGAGPMLASESEVARAGEPDWGSLEQAITLVQRMVAGNEGASPSAADFTRAVRDLYAAIQAATADPAALAGKVVTISEFLAKRAHGE